MPACRVYIGYADEDGALFNELRNHLSIGGTTVLHRGMVPPGENEDLFVRSLMASADLFVPLISAQYLASAEGQKELSLAHPRITPVLCRPCILQGTPLDGLRLLPRADQPMATSSNRDAVWVEVANTLLTQDPAQVAASPVPIVSVSPEPTVVPGKTKFALTLKWGAFALSITLSMFFGIIWFWPPPLLNPHSDLGALDDLGPPRDLAVLDMASPTPEDMAGHKDMRHKRKRDMADLNSADLGLKEQKDPPDLSTQEVQISDTDFTKCVRECLKSRHSDTRPSFCENSCYEYLKRVASEAKNSTSNKRACLASCDTIREGTKESDDCIRSCNALSK